MNITDENMNALAKRLTEIKEELFICAWFLHTLSWDIANGTQYGLVNDTSGMMQDAAQRIAEIIPHVTKKVDE